MACALDLARHVPDMARSRWFSSRTLGPLVVGSVLAVAAIWTGHRVYRMGVRAVRRARVERAFPEWRVALRGTPGVRPVPSGVLIDGHAPSTGVSFTRRLDPDQIYRLTVDGQGRVHLPSLRLQLDDQPPIWYALIDGGANIVLPSASRIEAMIYADAPYSFTLDAIKAEPCPSCITDAMLKARIIREAGLSAADEPLVLARKLLNWTASAVVLSLPPLDVTATTSAVVALSASQTYGDVFEPALGGVSCAGSAVFYQKVLAIFGLPSFTIDTGYDNGTALTHVTTILALGSPGHRRFYIFDPTFSGSYVNGGKMVDVVEILRGEPVQFQTTPIPRRVLIPQAEVPGFIRTNHQVRGLPVCDRASPLPATAECHGFVDSVAYNRVVMSRAMARNGFRPKQDFILGLMRHHVLGVVASTLDPHAHVEFLEHLAQFDIPVPKI